MTPLFFFQDSGADGVTKLLSNMMNVKQSTGGGATAISGAGISLGSVIPINDIRGLEGTVDFIWITSDF